jgi:putative membrane protein
MMDWTLFGVTWIKALHVISVIAWIAGMMYLPRLFVYHTAAETGSIQSETFKVMERRLFRGIITPAMGATWLFGLVMVLTPGIVDWSQGWPWVKAVAVIALSGIHGYYARQVKNFAADKNQRPQGFWRVVNEAPFVLVIIIVIMVIVKPF